LNPRRAAFGAAGLLFAASLVAAPPEAPVPAMAGSYQAAPLDPLVPALADYAVDKQRQHDGEPLTLLRVLGAQRQVVAGLNYRLRLQVLRGGQELTATAVVFVALDGGRALTDWVFEPAPTAP
jgi:hypothetical protein